MHAPVYARLYESTHVCVRTNACVHGWMGGWMNGWMDICIYVCMYICMYVCMYVCNSKVAHIYESPIFLKPWFVGCD